VDELVSRIEQELLSHVILESVHPGEPVVAHHVPPPWELLGTGNYAAVFAHADFPEWVVKIYAPGRPGLQDEAEVYAKLGEHPAYSSCGHAGEGYLVLKRLHGLTMFEHLRRGIRIPSGAIEDIDAALQYARTRGLYPHDVHAKNVMIDAAGRGLVVDISDFGHRVPCSRWDHIRKAYAWIYAPLLSWYPLPIPLWMLDVVRRGYRTCRRWLGQPD
jgi:hypothetical protein